MIEKINKKFVYNVEELQAFYNTYGLINGAKKLGRCPAYLYNHLKAAGVKMEGRGNRCKHLRKVMLIDA